VRSASTPCQLRVTSFASKSRLVDRHPLYVPASAAPHVRASHYGLRLAHCSEQYDHGPKITTTDWQTRSAGDEEVTNLEARGFDGWDHRRRRALVCGCVVKRSLNRRLADLVLVSEDPDRLVREGPMSSFDIDVFRDGGWWMVHIPELGGLTQARYPREVELMAREYIAVSTGTPIDQVAINWRGCTL